MNPMVQAFVERFSESTIKKMIDAEGFSAYRACLSSFWASQFQEAADETSGVLSANPEHPMRFGLYRLWIDALAELADFKSLKVLHEHLMMRGMSTEQDRATYMALRGLIHIELDQPHAAGLMYKAVASDDDSPYTMELETKISDKNLDSTGLPALINLEQPFSDYICWQSLVRSFVSMNQRHRAEPCLDLVDRIFPGSPLRDLCYFHWCSDIGDWQSAFESAERLHKTFSESTDYAFFAAHAALRLNRFNQSMAILENSKVINVAEDADAALIIGQALKNIGTQKRDIPTLQRAIKHLEIASRLIQEAGHDPMPAEMLKVQVQEQIKDLSDASASIDDGEEDLFRPTQAWLVKLSHRRYIELKNSKESHVTHLTRPMGSKARPGDLCFFAVEGAPNNKHTWKIAAIYTVESEPVWHPTLGHQSALQLIAMPKRLIPVAVQMANEPKEPGRKSFRSRHRDSQNGVFQLEEGVLDLIQEAIRLHQAGGQDTATNNPTERVI